jgi:hypothetical protein
VFLLWRANAKATPASSRLALRPTTASQQTLLRMNHTCCNNQTPDGYFQRHENGYGDLCARRKNARLKIEKLPAKWHDERKKYGKISHIV